MDIAEMEKVLKWYGYKDVHFSDKVDDRYYFRCGNWFVYIVEEEQTITIYQAREDFYEYYPIDSDMYDFEFEAEFNKEEIING